MVAILEASVDVATNIDAFGPEPRGRIGGEGPPYGEGPAIPLLVHSANSRYRDGIAAVWPNPEGRDAGREVVTLKNSSGTDIELSGWMLRDRAGNEYPLSGQVPAAAERAMTMSEFSMPLNNSGDRIRLVRPDGSVEHSVRYDGAEVAEGEPIRFH